MTLTEALDERRAALLSLPEARVVRGLKLDASFAAEMVIGRARLIAAYRDDLVAQFGPGAGTLVDELVEVAQAAMQADVELTAAAKPADLSAMAAALRHEHELLLTDARSLANRKLFDRDRVEAARGTHGNRAAIHNTLVLVAMFRDHWDAVASFTPVTRADLARAENQASEMLSAMGRRSRRSERAPAAELRTRALSALVEHWDDVRRMITYLRWKEGDADDLAPSFYARHRTRRARESPDVARSNVASPVEPDEAPTP